MMPPDFYLTSDNKLSHFFYVPPTTFETLTHFHTFRFELLSELEHWGGNDFYIHIEALTDVDLDIYGINHSQPSRTISVPAGFLGILRIENAPLGGFPSSPGILS